MELYQKATNFNNLDEKFWEMKIHNPSLVTVTIQQPNSSFCKAGTLFFPPSSGEFSPFKSDSWIFFMFCLTFASFKFPQSNFVKKSKNLTKKTNIFCIFKKSIKTTNSRITIFSKWNTRVYLKQFQICANCSKIPKKLIKFRFVTNHLPEVTAPLRRLLEFLSSCIFVLFTANKECYQFYLEISIFHFVFLDKKFWNLPDFATTQNKFKTVFVPCFLSPLMENLFKHCV